LPALSNILGQWLVQDGHLAKSDIVLGEQVEFLVDGRYTWGRKAGRYSLSEYSGITALTVQADWGEKYAYVLVAAGDIITLTRGTNCGKGDVYILQRVR
jgi:hypothetical protein